MPKCSCGKDIIKYEWSCIKKRYDDNKQEWIPLEEQDAPDSTEFYCEALEDCGGSFEPCIACEKLVDVNNDVFAFSGDDGILCEDCAKDE